MIALALLFTPRADAFTLPVPVPDWAPTERYCSDIGGPCAFIGESNDTSSKAFALGPLDAGDLIDTIDYDPGGEGGTGLFGSAYASLSHGNELIAADQYYVYEHVTKVSMPDLVGGTAGVTAGKDTDWYKLDVRQDVCVDVCFLEGKFDVLADTPTDWTLTVRNGTLGQVAQVTGPAPTGLSDTNCTTIVGTGASLFVEVVDPTPEYRSPPVFYRMSFDSSSGDLQDLWYTDTDHDGYGSTTSTGVLFCGDPGVGFSPTNDDCKDAVAGTHPDAFEICDGLDQDCDTQVDEGLPFARWWPDPDGDGWGDESNAGTLFCKDPGAGFVDRPHDCDETQKPVNPDGTEVCNGLDDNCDGRVDEGVLRWFYTDADGDTRGDPHTGVQACAAGAGQVPTNDDCDDANPLAFPKGTEVCDGADNDCDGLVDENITTSTWYVDADGDGFGDDDAVAIVSCEDPGDGYSASGGDCDDANGTVNPDATEACNGVDDDCDDTIDEGAPLTDWWPDVDGDGYGDEDASPTGFCGDPGTDWSASNDDCADDDAKVHPDAAEVPADGIDQDCDGADLCDADGDGYDAPGCDGDDCDDTNAAVHPGAVEVWYDGIDEDCAGDDDWDQDGDGHASGIHADTYPGDLPADDCADVDGEAVACDVWVQGGCDTGGATPGWLAVAALALLGTARRRVG